MCSSDLGETDGKRQIRVRGLTDWAVRGYPGTELAEGLFWAPDSNRLGFMTGGDLKSLDLATGVVKQITPITISNRGGSWGADDRILFATTSDGILMVPAVGGTPVPVTVWDRNRESNQIWPQWLPDGKHFLYFSRRVDAAQVGTYLGSVSPTGDRTEGRLVLAHPYSAYFTEGHLLFTRGTTLFAQPMDAGSGQLSGTAVPVAEVLTWRDVVTASRGGVLAIVPRERESKTIAIVDRHGKFLQAIGDPSQYLELRLSPDHRSIAAVGRSAEYTFLDIWIVNLANGTLGSGAAAQPASSWPDMTWVSVAGMPPAATSLMLALVVLSSARPTAWVDDPGREKPMVLPSRSLSPFIGLSAFTYQ